MRSLHSTLRLAAIAVSACAIAGGLAGCRGERTDKPPRQYFPGMDDQARYDAQSESAFFADGRTMREPPAGVVAYGWRSELSYGSTPEEESRAARTVALERADMLRGSQAAYYGRNADGTYVERIPVGDLFGLESGQLVPAGELRELVNRGEDRYMVFCYPCHGALGDGKGPVGTRWSGAGPANLLLERLAHGGENGQDGYMFDIIRNGLANAPGQLPAYRMMGYASQINERDTWAIVAYIRALQRSQATPLSDVASTAEQDRLRRSRPAAPQSSSEEEGDS